MHDNQLKRYEEVIAEDDISENAVHGIYLKTGYVDKYEQKQAEGDKYSVIDIYKFTDFLSKHGTDINSDIFRHYFSYISQSKTEMDAILAKVMDFHGNGEEYHAVFQHAYAQRECMFGEKGVAAAVKGVLAEAGIGDHKVDEGKESWDYGTSIGGDPWTQFYWYKASNKYQKEGIVEWLFWRLDGQYPLRLRHGVWPEKNEMYDNFHEDRGKRLALYRKIFAEEGREIFEDASETPAGRTGNESTVGEIHFKSSENSVRNIIDKLPEFHRRFIPRILSECE